MKIHSIVYSLGVAALACASLSSCEDYLSEMPDNRTTIDTEDKVVKLLTSAYSSAAPIVMVECVSDNIDDLGDNYSNYTSRFYDQLYAWQDITESSNDGPYFVWQGYYNAIAAANEALNGIQRIGGANTETLREAMAEALLCRAYSHYMLAYTFCMPYDPETASSELGLTYMTSSETTVNPEYERCSLEEYYGHIHDDIQQALVYVGDSHLTVPKYHFNRAAAYAFAAHFYLDYQKWDLAEDYATLALGTSPTTMLRNWDEIANTAPGDYNEAMTNLYVDEDANSNLLLMTATSMAGLWVGYPFPQGNTKYSHSRYLADTEDVMSNNNIWGSYTLQRLYPTGLLVYSGSYFNRVSAPKLNNFFYWQNEDHTAFLAMIVYPAFKADLTLLERAEARIMQDNYTGACEDLTLWMQNWTNSKMTLTPENITSYYRAMKYYTPFEPTQKKHLDPVFEIGEEGGTKESMLQCLLQFKRIETLYEGYRWFDIKRYGITVYRRKFNASGRPEELTDSLLPGDRRRALQLPQEVITAGYQPNPR